MMNKLIEKIAEDAFIDELNKIALDLNNSPIGSGNAPRNTQAVVTPVDTSLSANPPPARDINYKPTKEPRGLTMPIRDVRQPIGMKTSTGVRL